MLIASIAVSEFLFVLQTKGFQGGMNIQFDRLVYIIMYNMLNSNCTKISVFIYLNLWVAVVMVVRHNFNWVKM